MVCCWNRGHSAADSLLAGDGGNNIRVSSVSRAVWLLRQEDGKSECEEGEEEEEAAIAEQR